MGRSIERLSAIIGLGFWLAACSGSSKGSNPSDRVCEPGSKSCDGKNVKVCSDDGTERTIEKTCSPSQTCAEGACAETACVPNTKFCQGGDVWKCDSTGSGRTVAQTCASSQFCREEDDSARCSDQFCTAAQPLCDGDVATICLDDGSGPVPGGTDCADNKQACVDGECKDTACIAGQKVCLNGDVYLCAKNGADTSLLADCQSGSVCDGDTQTCLPKVCEVGSTGCDGTTAVDCNAFGSGWEPVGTDCALSNKVCVDGDCKKQTCSPGSNFCQDGDVFRCDSSGVTSSLWQTCYGSQYCVSADSFAYCAQGCEPNRMTCSGNIVRQCNEDGSFPEEGTECAEDEYCEDGAGCKEKTCEPGTIFCDDGDVYGCNWLGSAADLYQECPSETTCKVSSDSAYSCIPMPCPPGETACLGNKVGVCADDGLSLASVTTDCTASTSVCGPDNKCAKTAVDTLGLGEDSYTQYSGTFFGDVVQVTSTRKLTEMEISLDLRTPRELRWVVFEETAQATYTARKDWIVSNETGNGFFSSGVINYALKAGRTYLFGVVITGGNTSTAVIDTAPFPATTSIGTVLGRVETSYSSLINAFPDAQSLYHMKLTTAP